MAAPMSAAITAAIPINKLIGGNGTNAAAVTMAANANASWVREVMLSAYQGAIGIGYFLC